jgi:hypothetical protein
MQHTNESQIAKSKHFDCFPESKMPIHPVKLLRIAKIKFYCSYIVMVHDYIGGSRGILTNRNLIL